MAKTASGMEFYLVEATPSANVDSSEVEGSYAETFKTGIPCSALMDTSMWLSLGMFTAPPALPEGF